MSANVRKMPARATEARPKEKPAPKSVTLIFVEVDGEEVAVSDSIRMTAAAAMKVQEFVAEKLGPDEREL